MAPLALGVKTKRKTGTTCGTRAKDTGKKASRNTVKRSRRKKKQETKTTEGCLVEGKNRRDLSPSSLRLDPSTPTPHVRLARDTFRTETSLYRTAHRESVGDSGAANTQHRRERSRVHDSGLGVGDSPTAFRAQEARGRRMTKTLARSGVADSGRGVSGCSVVGGGGLGPGRRLRMTKTLAGGSACTGEHPGSKAHPLSTAERAAAYHKPERIPNEACRAHSTVPDTACRVRSTVPVWRDDHALATHFGRRSGIVR
eukprot:2950351-Rhodomonas_salina.3